jgi:ATP-dependent Clp protease ATP-binding subunit ClpA
MPSTPRIDGLRRRLGPSASTTADHLLLPLLRSENIVAELISSLGANPSAVANEIEASRQRAGVSEERLLKHASGYAAILGHTHTGSTHILLAVMDDQSSASYAVLRRSGITRDAVWTAVLKKLGVAKS